MWNLKNKTSEQIITKQEQTHRYREESSGYQRGDVWGKERNS